MMENIKKIRMFSVGKEVLDFTAAVRWRNGAVMDAVVTVRIPVEIKEQGNALLRELGDTPTQLINAAYEYVLANGALPQPKITDAKRQKSLTAESRHALRTSLDHTTFTIPNDFWKDASYKTLLEEGRKADYETLP